MVVDPQKCGCTYIFASEPLFKIEVHRLDGCVEPQISHFVISHYVKNWYQYFTLVKCEIYVRSISKIFGV